MLISSLTPVWGTFCSDKKPYKYMASMVVTWA